MDANSRILVSFSCGAASAVAAKIAVELYGATHDVQVVYADTSNDEHEDNKRFLRDVEAWIGRPVTILRSDKYRTAEEVWLGERYVVSPRGASCTRALKRRVIDAYNQPGDVLVLGLAADEESRIDDFEDRWTGGPLLWLLRDNGITKEDCYHIIMAAGITLSTMYLLGFDHSNCLGCPKGGMGYWNKIRAHFPWVFWRRALIFWKLGVRLRSGGKLYWLHELHPAAGRNAKEPPIECGVFCEDYAQLIPEIVEGATTKESVFSLPITDAP